MRSYSDAEMQRAAVASQEFIDAYCAWWPAVYKSLMPVSFDGKLLMQAKAQVEKRMADDFAAYQAEQASPWLKEGLRPRLIDWTGVKDRPGGFLPPPAGYPGWLKPGRQAPPEVERRAVEIGNRRASIEKRLSERLHALRDEMSKALSASPQDQKRAAEVEAMELQVLAEREKLGAGAYDDGGDPEILRK